MIDRRQLLALTLSTAATAAMPGAACATAGFDPAPAGFAELLSSFAEEFLRLWPETATTLGLDSGARVALKSQLDDASPADDARWAAQVESMLRRLAALNPAQLSPVDQLRYESIKYAAAAGREGTRFYCGSAEFAFNYNGAVPYPVSQQDGAVIRVPEFLDTEHPISNAEDAEAYLARVAALARVLDQESARIAEQAARRVMPPRFIAENTLGQLTGYRRTPVAEQKLVTSLVTRAQALGITGDWGARATRLVESQVYPALDRQIAAFAKATAHAPDIAGVDRLPDGEAYYDWALKLGTTTDMSAAEIHAIGLEQNQAIQTRMDAVLKAQGMTQGSVGERIHALSGSSGQRYPDTDEGRRALMDYCDDRLRALRALMPRFSRLRLAAPLIFKQVPADIQDGAAIAYMQGPSLDNTRPAVYYLNLKSNSAWPRYQIPTTTAHEGVPGHTWQGAYLAEHHHEIPLFTQLLIFNAFVEGWALYAEQSVDELGLYERDQLGQLGYLQSQQYRACRLVVDTGIHAMKWTREQAIQFLMAQTGMERYASTSEIDRYCANPGQACGYKVGHNEFLRQRERARAALGAKFDLAAFNDALVETGGVPLSVLGTAVDQFVAGIVRPQ